MLKNSVIIPDLAGDISNFEADRLLPFRSKKMADQFIYRPYRSCRNV